MSASLKPIRGSLSRTTSSAFGFGVVRLNYVTTDLAWSGWPEEVRFAPVAE